MNMDPRSNLLNTEMGVVIESPELAAQLLIWRENQLPREAWRVTLEGLEKDPPAAKGEMLWVAGDAGSEVMVSDREPQASFVRRVVVGLLRWLPIENQL
jgi:putative cardiolipin synthase